MLALRNQRICEKALCLFVRFQNTRNARFLNSDNPSAQGFLHSFLDCDSSSLRRFNCTYSSSISSLRVYSTSRSVPRGRGSSMRSKVEKRMRQESGKTFREIRRARKLKKKLMTDEERLLYGLRRAKKKVAVLLQRLKKYELPEFPPSVHDPELLTPEQFQAYKKIGFKNKNYVPVGVRGVFGGVVQNMHMHWKFHETVQVCCDNFPREKIKEMATMLAKLSGGIVVNIHDVKTIIMFRGRNYKQPKNLIPFNTLTKRKALFKARFEQALESQKLNIKKLEQQLRRMGVNPEDPIAMASIQRVASTFFSAIDQKEGSPYVFSDKLHSMEEREIEEMDSRGDSDQEELDRFIAEIEDAADKEWAAEEEAEREEYGQIRYWNKENFGGRRYESEGDDSDGEESRLRHGGDRKINRRLSDNESESEKSDAMLSDVDDAMWGSETERRNESRRKFSDESDDDHVEVDGFTVPEYVSESDEEDFDIRDSAEFNDDYDLKQIKNHEVNRRSNSSNKSLKDEDEIWDSD